MLRLFVAVDVPESQRLSIERAIHPLKPRLQAARWTARESWHVTLKFLGSTPEVRLADVSEAVATVAEAAEPGETWLTGLGVFPRAGQARVLWIGLDDGAGRLAALAGRLEDAVEPLGYARESRPWRPHLTVARFKVPTPVDLEDAAPVPPDPFPVQEILLFRSQLKPRGAVYEVLGRYALGA